MFRFARTVCRTAATTPLIDALEPRQLLSAATMKHGTLTIYGSNADDTITLSGIVQDLVITRDPGGGTTGAQYEASVTINGQQTVFNAADVRRVRIFAFGGNDTITVQDSLTSNLTGVTIDGGDGDDTITDATTTHRYNRPERITVLLGTGNDQFHNGAHTAPPEQWISKPDVPPPGGTPLYNFPSH